VTTSILSKNLFFDYANDFKKRNKTITPAASFQLSDADYSQFVASMASKDYSYTSRTERLLSDLREEAEKENKLNVVKADLDDLKEKMLGAKKTDLITHKAEIKKILETQIVSRYYYERGKVVQAFQYDKELAAAKSLLGNSTKMLAILKGEGEYKTIGSPVKTMTAAAADNN
jgi:carboxyl-terminal processing protease